MASVALVEPEFPLNVGYVARSMANFGLKELYIVAPRGKQVSFDLTEATVFSSHGKEVVAGAKFLDDMDSLRKRFAILVGTTAIRGSRKSNITRKTLGLHGAVPIVARAALSHQSREVGKSTRGLLCFVFGRDTTGLKNEELKKCDYAVTISTQTMYNTLNISHAAAILFYAFSQHNLHELSPVPGEEEVSGKATTRTERERVIYLFQELALRSDFQDYKRDKLREAITRLLDRSNPSLRELYLLMGLANKARRKIEVLSART